MRIIPLDANNYFTDKAVPTRGFCATAALCVSIVVRWGAVAEVT